MRVQMNHLTAGLLASALTLSCASPATAVDPTWKAEQIADALTAAPPSVTQDAEIYAWKSKGNMVKVREGSGAYKCVASGNFSIRRGKPALPFPDPMCMDANAWAFFTALWNEKNPRKPEKPYPTAPGMVWMLAGMSAPQGWVANHDNPDAESKTVGNGKKIFRMSPHIMLMPLRIKGKDSILGSKYDTKDPAANWVMFPDTLVEHLMIHFSWEEAAEMMAVKPK